MFRQYGQRGVKSSKARKAGQGLTPAVMQALEERKLLTVVTSTYASEAATIFRYQQDANNTIGVYQWGDTAAVYIGATADQDGNVLYTDLPGEYEDFEGNIVEYLGGLGGRAGSDIYGPISITDGSLTDIESPIGQDAVNPQSGIRNNNLQNFGINNEGEFYGINYTRLGGGGGGGGQGGGQDAETLSQIIQLVHFDQTGAGETIAHLGAASLRTDVMYDAITVGAMEEIGRVTDLAVSPTNGYLYVLSVPDGDDLSNLLTVVDLATGTAIAQTYMVDSVSATNVNDSQAMAFQPDGTLWVFTPDYDADQTADASDLDAGEPQSGAENETTRVTSNLDPAIVRVNSDPNSGNFGQWSSNLAGGGIRLMVDSEDNYEKILDFSAMIWNSDAKMFYAIGISPVDVGGTSSGGGGGGGTDEDNPYTEFFTFGLQGLQNSPNVITFNDIDAIEGGGGTGGGGGGGDSAGLSAVTGLAWSYDINDDKILTATIINESSVNGVPSYEGQLMKIIYATSGEEVSITTEFLNRSNDSIRTQGLASYTPDGSTRSFIYGIDEESGALCRGSTVFLPIDPETGESYVVSITAGAFNPLEENRYYFVWETSTGINDSDSVQYFSAVDITLDNVELNPTEIQNTLQLIGGINLQDDHNEEVFVNAIVFDQFADDKGNHVTMYALNQNNTSLSVPITVDEGKTITTAPTFVTEGEGTPNETESTVSIRVDGVDLETSSGMVFIGTGVVVRDGVIIGATGPSATEQEVFGWTISDSNLIRFNLECEYDEKTGFPLYRAGMIWGAVDYDDGKNITAVNDISAMIFSPVITDPITNTPGALIAVCPGIEQTGAAFRDNLMILDCRLRPAATSVFQTVVLESDEDSKVILTKVTLQNNEWVTSPGQGSIGDLSILNMNSNEQNRPATVTFPDGTGPVYVGARNGTTPLTSGGLGDFATDFLYSWKNESLELTAGFYVLEDGDGNPMNIGQYVVDGALTGNVYISGAAGLIYTGVNLVGETRGSTGDTDSATSSVPNFVVGGDLLSLISKGPMGTNDANTVLTFGTKGTTNITDYSTALKIQVGGSLGIVRSLSDISAVYDVFNDPNAPSMSTDYVVREYESDGNIGEGFIPVGLLENNDTQATAQRLFPVTDSKGTNVFHVVGDNSKQSGIDPDFFSFSLMPGQKIRVIYTFTSIESLSLYDPAGRQVISTNQSRNTELATSGSSFEYTVDEPGLWCVGIQNSSYFDLTIRVLNDNGYGRDMAIGAVQADSLASWNSLGSVFMVHNGDIGSIESTGQISLYSDADALVGETLYAQGGYTPDQALQGAIFDLTNGDLRYMASAGAAYVSSAKVRGTVGLIQTGGRLDWNTEVASLGIPRVNDHVEAGVARQVAIDGNYLHVVVGGDFSGAFITKKAIGVIDVGGNFTNTTDTPTGIYGSFICVDADKAGRDGVIDLLHIGGSMDGAPISTGRGGNVRYMVVEGTIRRDSFYGGLTSDDWIDYLPGSTITVYDDSGTPVKITSTTPTRGGDETGFEIRTYGIRGSGGAVICNVRTEGGVSITAKAANSLTGRAEIGLLEVNGEGTAYTTNDNGKPVAPARGEAQLNALFSGNVPVDVFSLTGGDFFSVQNTSQRVLSTKVGKKTVKQTVEYGEIVNIDAGSIYSLKLPVIGFSKQTTDQPVHDQTVRNNAMPFNTQYNLIQAGGFGFISSLGALGNIYSSGDIYQVTANSDKKNTPNLPVPKVALPYEGVVAPIYSTGGIFNVNVGAGLAPTGNGDFAHSGIFADGEIGTIRSDGGDIRGDIWSGTSIQNIYLRNNASLLWSDVLVTNSIDNVLESSNSFTMENGGYDDEPTIASITIQGKPGLKGKASNGGGGILGCRIYCSKLGSVRVINGFGIINTSFANPGEGDNQYKIMTDGYGLRDCTIDTYTGGGQIIVKGNGAQLPTTLYSPTVRRSETMTYDPLTGLQFTKLTDLSLYLGTTAKKTTIANDNDLAGVTRSGVIAGISMHGDRSLSLIQAWRMTFSRQLGTYYTSTINVNQLVKKIQIAESSIDLQINTAKLDNLIIGKNLHSANIIVAGPIGTIRVGGNVTINPYDGEDIIEAIGSNGTIKSIIIGGKMDSDIRAGYKIYSRSVRNKTGIGRFYENDELVS